MSIRIERVELIRGKGRLSWGGNIYSVGYVIDVYQKFNESVPLLKSTTGRVTAKPGDLVYEMLRMAMHLELQDGRRAQIFLKNLNGDFEVTGPFEPAPKKGE